MLRFVSQRSAAPSFLHATVKRIPTLLFRLDGEPKRRPLPEKGLILIEANENNLLVKAHLTSDTDKQACDCPPHARPPSEYADLDVLSRSVFDVTHLDRRASFFCSSGERAEDTRRRAAQ